MQPNFLGREPDVWDSQTILAIDPGTTDSALIEWDGTRILSAQKIPNAEVLKIVRGGWAELYIEMIASYGMPVGREVFETCVWIGRYLEAAGGAKLVYRRDIKLWHCASAKAKDSNIRQALIDKYGAPGTKKAPGTTYGLKADLWQAFALAAFVTESKEGIR